MPGQSSLDTEPSAPRGFTREVAHRAFAAEFNASRQEIKGQGEKDPSYLVTPLGAKVNRIHIVGVCTDVEAVGDSGEQWRARISDPSGIFTVYAGNYQPEAAHALSQLQPPQFVAVTGKARSYEPEPGSVFVSIRPESVTVVDKATRDQWILQTAQRTQERLAATRAVAANPGAPPEALQAGGVPRAAIEGALLAAQHYGTPDADRFAAAVRTCLTPLATGSELPVQRLEPRPDGPTQTAWKQPGAAPAIAVAPAGPDPAAAKAEEALDNGVLAAVQRLEGAKGAKWDDVLAACAVGGASAEDVEEALNRLMDKGLVYEPTLGVLKTT